MNRRLELDAARVLKRMAERIAPALQAKVVVIGAGVSGMNAAAIALYEIRRS